MHDTPRSGANIREGLADDELRLNDRVRSIVGNGGITEFARKLGLNHESVRRYVRGATAPPALFLLRVASRCDVDCRWLLTGEREHEAALLRSASTEALTREIDRRVEAFLELAQDHLPADVDPQKRSALVFAIMDRLAQMPWSGDDRRSEPPPNRARAIGRERTDGP